MITTLIEMLDLQNFSRMTTSAIKFESRDKILLMMFLAKIMTSLF